MLRSRSTSIQALTLGSLLALASAACGGRSIGGGADEISGGADNTSVGGSVSGVDGASAGAGASSGAGAASGGSNGSGAPGVAGDGAVAGGCPSTSACGGNMVGTWSVVSSCLHVGGQLDLSALGIGCATAPISQGYRQVTGSWSAHADGTYTDATKTSGEEEFELGPECLAISGVQISCERLGPLFGFLGYNAVSCMAVPKGGCACSASIKQSGGLGVISGEPSSVGTFTNWDDVVTLDGQRSYPYCAVRDRLTLTPEKANPTVTGSVEFEREAK